ncbi:lipopolysaccharide biosynthesis protein [Acinetobacter albensis]|nr:oligosaccharide flippase family protein [Acinetobacter albensis]
MQTLVAKYKSIGLITSSLLIGAIITFIALPFLTRLYSIHDFGHYGVALAVVSVLSTISNLRLDQAQLIADDVDQKSLIFEGTVFSLIFCVFASAGLIIFFDWMTILAICFGVLANSLVQSVYNYKFAHEAEFFCACLNIFRSLIVVLMQLGLPIFLSISLVNSYAISSVVMILTILVYIVINQLYQVSWKSYKNYKDFIFANTPHALLNSFSHNLPYYIVLHFVGYQAVGFYSIVERTLRMPINLISQTVRQFFIRKFKNQETPREALKSTIFLSLVSLPFFAIFFVLPESIYLLIFGQEWVGISLYFKILALGYWAVFCNPPSSAYLIAKRNSQVLFRLQIAELAIKFIIFGLLYLYISNKLYMLIALPISLIFYNVSIFYVVWRDPK